MIQNIPLTEKPRERCLKFGPQSLSLRECLAVLLGIGPKGVGCLGLGESILKETKASGTEEQKLEHLVEGEFESLIQGMKGIGPSGLSKISVALELARRYHAYKAVKFQNQGALSQKPRPKWDPLFKVPHSFRISAKENFALLPRTASGQTGAFIELAQGTSEKVNVHPKDILRTALLHRADQFWVFHNHPSGEITPSPQDIRLTRELKVLCRQLGMELLDHIIVSAQQAYSIRHRNMMNVSTDSRPSSETDGFQKDQKKAR